ncbi:MAG: FtsX-like permease family protein [Bacteroidota bacterium]
MIQNHLKIAWRNLRRNMRFSLLNILGLSTGLAGAFLIYFWVSDELMVDKFHTNGQHLYQILEKSTENGEVRIHESTQGPLADALETDLPEVQKAVNVMNLGKLGASISFKNKVNLFKSEGLFAESTFFEVFTFPLIYGSPSQALIDKDAIVISENFAEKLFGSVEKAINQNVEYDLFGQKSIAKITGIFKDVPNNSTLKFDYVATKQKLLEDIWTNGQVWSNEGPDTYVLLNSNVDIPVFDRKIENFISKYDENTSFSLFTRKFSDSYLKGNYENGVQSGGRITYVRLFSLIAILVLLIACINFMNLSTARVSRRFKEIGIKKTIGGTKKNLVIQFLVESLFLTFLSLLVAIILVIMLIPVFNFITGKELGFQFTLNDTLIVLLVTLFTGLLSGSYPAFYLSGFSPLATLKGKFQGKLGELFIRKGLVVFQFMVSLVLIISVLVIGNQIDYAFTKPLGYEKENLIQIDLEGKAFQNPQLLFDQLETINGVLSAGGISESIVREDGGSSTYGVDWPGMDEEANIDFILRGIDEKLVSTLNIEMAEGQNFSEDLGTQESYLLFNKEAIRLMGLKNPIGTKVKLWGEDKTILGVMKNFHTASVMQTISPLVFRYTPQNLEKAMVRIKPGAERDVIGEIEDIYTKYNPEFRFNFAFMDQTIEAQYLSEQRILSLARYFAYMAIFISCLGLFGLAAFNTEMRVKEIGVRKVLGSSSFGILKLLSSDFVKLVLLSILIASPVAWYLMRDWLSQFAYRIDVGWTVFVVAGILTILIALATVSFQALKAANTNPIKSLRTE